MTLSTQVQSIDNTQILEHFLDNPELKKQRSALSNYFGNPVWWVASLEASGKKTRLCLDPRSTQIWHDSRLKRLPGLKALFRQISQKPRRDHHSFRIECPDGKLKTYCIPLVVEGREVGYLGLSNLKPKTKNGVSLELLSSVVQTLLVSTKRGLELTQLSESVRPRAIALSTVHTVHRIINSTLNLDELLTRLTYLTAQVLRAKTCTIFLNDKSRPPRTLRERAKAGFNKKNCMKLRAYKPGDGFEGKVFKTAKFVLRKHLVSVPLIDEDVIGVMTLVRKKGHQPFNPFDREILTTLAEEAVIAIKNAQLYEEQRKVTLSTIQSLANILGHKLQNHSKIEMRHMLEITLSMADILKLSDEEKQAIHHATLLKDAGKMGLPDELLHKHEKLTDPEYQLIRQHTIKGAAIIQSFENLRPIVPIILHAHEKFDGSGYPEGLKGTHIPIGARILAVVNAFEALIAGRPYRSKTTFHEAVGELDRNSGTQFDPRVLEAFRQVMRKPHIVKKVSLFDKSKKPGV